VPAAARAALGLCERCDTKSGMAAPVTNCATALAAPGGLRRAVVASRSTSSWARTRAWRSSLRPGC